MKVLLKNDWGTGNLPGIVEAVTHPGPERQGKVMVTSFRKEGEVYVEKDDLKRAVAFG